MSNYASATFLVMWAYDGWNNLSYSAGELGDPVRQLPRATALGVLFATCLYVLANFAYFMVVPLADLVASSELLAGTFFNVVFGGVMGAHVFPMLLALSAYGAVSAMVFSAGRVAQAAALAGVLPYSAYFRHLHAATGTPVRALALNWLLTVALIVSPPSRNAFDFLVDLVSYPEWVFYGKRPRVLLTVPPNACLTRRQGCRSSGSLSSGTRAATCIGRSRCRRCCRCCSSRRRCSSSCSRSSQRRTRRTRRGCPRLSA